MFANSTCFDDRLVQKISERANKLKIGTRVITFTTSLNNPNFEIIDTKQFGMSWGTATCYIHLKIN